MPGLGRTGQPWASVSACPSAQDEGRSPVHTSAGGYQGAVTVTLTFTTESPGISFTAKLSVPVNRAFGV